jgi:hypothetical protein
LNNYLLLPQLSYCPLKMSSWSGLGLFGQDEWTPNHAISGRKGRIISHSCCCIMLMPQELQA